MKIGLIGYGVVNKAVSLGFTACDIVINDPHIGFTDWFSLLETNFIFIGVPTPSNENGCDYSIIKECLKKLENDKYGGVVIIKSSITPDAIDEFKKYEINLVYNPEFLTERFAVDEFINQPMLVIGSENKELIEMVNDLYLNYSNINYPDDKVYGVDLKTASLFKYCLNCFFATKVTFMNQMSQLLDKSDTNTSWNKFQVMLGNFPWIADKHLDVPGHDGKYGYGGKCYPDNMKALYEYSKKIGSEFSLLDNVMKINESIR